MNREEALAFTCTDHLLQVNPLFNKIMQPLEITTTTKPIPPNTGQYTSWIAKGAHWFTIIKHNNQTLVYCHFNQMMFYASPNIQLHPLMPDGHAFLAQTCIDNNTTPRLLILDIIHPYVEDPQARGHTLRQLTQFFPTTSCHVQWAGDVTSLRKFLANGLPHPVECIVSLQKPMQITREQVPSDTT